MIFWVPNPKNHHDPSCHHNNKLPASPYWKGSYGGFPRMKTRADTPTFPLETNLWLFDNKFSYKMQQIQRKTFDMTGGIWNDWMLVPKNTSVQHHLRLDAAAAPFKKKLEKNNVGSWQKIKTSNPQNATVFSKTAIKQISIVAMLEFQESVTKMFINFGPKSFVLDAANVSVNFFSWT